MEGKALVICLLWAGFVANRPAAAMENMKSESRETHLPPLLLNNQVCSVNVPNCASCLDHRTCQRCQDDKILLESYWGASCVDNCPDDFTEIRTEDNGVICRTTKGCSRILHCSQCEEQFDDICDRCEDGYLLMQPGTGPKVQCVASCPAGFVKHGTRCKPEMCEDFFCSRCQDGWVLQYKQGTKCLSNCPSGFFRKEDMYNGQPYCKMCRANCKSCQDSYNCDVCESEFYLIKDVFSKCLLSCPAGFLAGYSLDSGKVCDKDTRGCLDKTCSHCQDGWYRVRIRRDFHCRQECPQGYFEIEREGKPRVCGRCSYNCQKCLSRRECKKCKEGLFNVVRGGRLFCVWHCPRGYIPQEDEEKSCVKANDNFSGRL